jgi:hypothetical protein
MAEDADGYPLQTVKKLMAFLWTIEPQIDQFHPNRRAKLSEDGGNTGYEPLRRGSELSRGKYTDRWVQLTVYQLLII